MSLRQGDYVRLNFSYAQTPSPFLIPIGATGDVRRVEPNGYCWVIFHGREQETLVDGAFLTRFSPLEALARCAE